MARKRSNKNAWMPPYTRFDNGWFVYDRRSRKEFKRLARADLPRSELLKAYEDFTDPEETAFRDCINAYLRSPQFLSLAPGTKQKYITAIATQGDPKKGVQGDIELMYSFGHMRPEDITAPKVRRFMDDWADMPSKANTMYAVLKVIIEWNIERGHMFGPNPCASVKKFKEKRGGRYVDDIEYKAFFNFLIDENKKSVACAMAIAYLCGSRLQDVLRLTKHRPFNTKETDCYATKDGLMIYQQKTGKVQLKRFSDELRRVYDLACNNNSSNYVICNTRGLAYTRDGFKSVWQTAQVKAMEQGVINQRFRFHDMKLKAASDVDPERRTFFLGSTESTANRYNRTADAVDPVR